MSTTERAGGDNVVSIRSAAPSSRLKKLDWNDKRTQCQHRHVEIWPREPILECSDCGLVIDPYQWIRLLTQEWDNYRANLSFQRSEIAEEIKSIKAELRILRGEYKDEAERREIERAIMRLPPRRARV